MRIASLWKRFAAANDSDKILQRLDNWNYVILNATVNTKGSDKSLKKSLNWIQVLKNELMNTFIENACQSIDWSRIFEKQQIKSWKFSVNMLRTPSVNFRIFRQLSYI